ncbi:hypothetical protein [Austwickia chelonae]|uniref:hypothetical protein n=1 Tax=Austwickia chelonae TaxID=100225 RepID=UPI000E230C1A|nr:hypothetical protein [Austwickia chelonae]
MAPRKHLISTAAAVVAALAVTGGAVMANASSAPSPAPSPSPSASAPATPGPQDGPSKGQGRGEHGKSHGKKRGIEVTGDEAKKVTDAVKAKDSGVEVIRIVKNKKGEYRVKGKKDGHRIGFAVSSDLKTVIERPGWGKGGEPRGPRRDGQRPGDGKIYPQHDRPGDGQGQRRSERPVG